MAERNHDIDLKAAINAISDVVQNRPRPIRQMDQIYMKTGDMVLQSHLVAHWAKDKQLAFIGDGDAISVCVAYLRERGIIEYGPSRIDVYDFDERIVGAVTRFADKMRLETLQAHLYNCLDAFPVNTVYDAFYTNPPWGASNNGVSVEVFTQRGMEAIGYDGEGMVVIADDDGLEWTQRVLANTQRFAIASGFYVSKMMPRRHLYHLDDDPDLMSCNLLLRSLPGTIPPMASESITDLSRLEHFYGRSQHLRVRYIREKKRLDYGMAHEDEYCFELLEENL